MVDCTIKRLISLTGVFLIMVLLAVADCVSIDNAAKKESEEIDYD